MFSTYFAIYILADVSLTYKMSKFGAFKTISFFSSVQINLLWVMAFQTSLINLNHI